MRKRREFCIQPLRGKCTPIPALRDFPHREACHWILGRLRLPTNPVPLPPRRGKQGIRLRRFPSANLSPVGSSFPRKEPRSVSIARYLVRVIRIPSAAPPLSCFIKRRFPAYRVVTPSQAFSWEISRLIVAVAIFKDRFT